MKKTAFVFLLLFLASCSPRYVITGFDNCRYIGYVKCDVHYRDIKTGEAGFVQCEKNPLKVGNVVRIRFSKKIKIRKVKDKLDDKKK